VGLALAGKAANLWIGSEIVFLYIGSEEWLKFQGVPQNKAPVRMDVKRE
jgi:hypothetical protein